jgi:DNA-directed RNA polymerase I and III subunit RPAC2
LRRAAFSREIAQYCAEKRLGERHSRRRRARAAMASVYEKTFTLKDEDHTMGNTIRYMLNKNPQVSLAGYSVPHPMETSVNVRVQTTGEVTATAAMRDALLDIISVCDHVHDTFGDAVDEFKAKNPTGMDTGKGKK